jgi:hypothetical protein
VNSGSDGHDGAFNPTTNTVINLASHPDGIYHYTSVNIPTNVIVTFIPNANNTPVTWLVQSNCLINGTVQLSGQAANGGAIGGSGGPGGWAGGNGGSNPSAGLGPGGGTFEAGVPVGLGGVFENGINGPYGTSNQKVYGNSFLLPLLGGSGGGGNRDLVSSYWNFAYYGGAGGGGGAILVAASGVINVSGQILANGGDGNSSFFSPGGYTLSSGSGSGGGIRLVATQLAGSGRVSANSTSGGTGRIRFDTLQNTFGGTINGAFTQGFQPITIPTAGQGAQLTVTSIGGVAVPPNPSANPANPAAVIPAQQSGPVQIVVRCSNLPLNTAIAVTVKPLNGSPVSAMGYNNSGTVSNSTVTVSINMPRGGGIIYATAATSP